VIEGIPYHRFVRRLLPVEYASTGQVVGFTGQGEEFSSRVGTIFSNPWKKWKKFFQTLERGKKRF